MRTMDGITLTPILGIGTFCTHTLVHSKQCIPVRSGAAAGADESDWMRRDDRRRRGALFGRGETGTSVAVFGCGGVGDSVIMGSRLAGATTIIGVDIDPRKLEWAREFGATHTVNPTEGDPVEAIKAITGGYGVNYSFEAVGRPDTTMQAIFSRDLAGTCVIIGVAGPQSTVDELPLGKFFDLGGNLRVSWYGDCLPTRDFPLLAEWYQQGRLDLDRVVTRIISLDEAEEGFHAMERGETLRSVIRI